MSIDTAQVDTELDVVRRATSSGNALHAVTMAAKAAIDLLAQTATAAGVAEAAQSTEEDEHEAQLWRSVASPATVDAMRFACHALAELMDRRERGCGGAVAALGGVGEVNGAAAHLAHLRGVFERALCLDDDAEGAA